MYACICNKNHEQTSTTEKFGFSPIGYNFSVQPSSHLKPSNNPTVVTINPQDIVLNKNVNNTYDYITTNQNKEYLFDNPGNHLMETAQQQSLYLNFDDILFNNGDSSMDLMFSIGCPDESFSSSSSICSAPTRRSSTSQPTTSEELLSLPPSVAILQSELNKSSLDDFIKNNSFIEGIRSSIPEEQQQYINSGIANVSPMYTSVTVPSTVNEKTYDLVSSTTDCNNLFSKTKYDDFFNQDDNSSLDMDYSLEETDNAIEEQESRISSLLSKLNNFNRRQRHDHHLLKTLKDIKLDYDSEINRVLEHQHKLSLEKDLDFSRNTAKLYKSIFKAYEKANLKIQNIQSMNKESSTDLQKRALFSCNTKDRTTHNKLYYNLQEKYDKKTRKNYNQDVVNILMDWFLNNDGKTPTSKDKLVLTRTTGKSITQISTWFQNAKRRYQKKLELYQSLASEHPTKVFDTESFIKYLKVHKKDL